MSTPTVDAIGDGLAVAAEYENERGKPMPSQNHGVTQANLVGEILKDKRFRPISELRVRPAATPFVPDICVYRRQPVDFSHDVTERTDPPLTVVEIYSPHQGYNAVM